MLDKIIFSFVVILLCVIGMHAQNLRWGEEYKSARRKLNNSDSESGIMSGGK